MGIVLNQSSKNFVVTYLGFGVGAINLLFLYTYFLPNDYHGLVSYILSTAAIMMPILALGTHNTIIKFYSSFRTRNSINSFLTLMLLFPFLAIIPIGVIGCFSYEMISNSLSKENEIIKNYVWLIYIAAICFAYFEIFYAWAKVQMKSVFGNFMKEVFHRVGVLLLFIGIYYKWITVDDFIYGVIIIYILRVLIMMGYAFALRRPVLRFKKITNVSSIIKYSLLIIIAGSVASIILEIDKFMLGQYIVIDNIAFYGIAVYIATVIGVPARSMHQITNPITAKFLNDNDKESLKDLYKKSSINLFIIGGFVFLLITLNINELYTILPEEFRGGVLVVFLIGLAKLIDNLIGNNNAILFNSNYYRIVLLLGFILAILAVILNVVLIPVYGIYGAAYATFISIVVYNICKVGFVYIKFKMIPFTLNTFKTIIVLGAFICTFYFWEFTFHPILNIILKSMFISLLYAIIVYRFNLSDDITIILNKYIKK
ncbi:polysaccharide biosynthesis protein [Flavobacteriaceae bacterium AU392]|nr:polysaccharide biosynthesis protein [Flavobacteriaceae bacterium]RKM85482.1 polysaccharide biosynthesis protein [Flavobacteriaceae bacterium AU392]